MTDTAARCVDPACTDGPTDSDDRPAPRWAKDGNLCRRCGSLLEQRLAELKARHDAVVQVMLTTLPTRGSSGGNKPTKGAPPVELNLRAHDWVVEATQTAVSWVQMTCEERGLRGPDRSDVGLLSAWLLSQLDWWLRHDVVGDLADEMRDLSRKADAIAPVNPQRHRLPAPCPVLGCGAHELTREDGDDRVWCGACGGIWTEDEYPWMVRVALAANGGCLTASEAAERAGVKPEVFRQWVSRGRVRRLGTVDGLARYSTADLNEVLNEGEVAS